MKKTNLYALIAITALGGAMSSCSSTKSLFLDSMSPEEYSLNPVKITDESQNSVIGNRENLYTYNLSGSGYGGYRGKSTFVWDTGKRLAVSPSGDEIAYLSIANDAPNVMIRKTQAGGSSTQRTFRKAQNVAWGKDNRLYFNDNTGSTSTIGSVDSKQGSLVKQLTNNNNDWTPVLSADGNLLYFTRFDSTGPYIWSYNLSNGELTNCTRGFDPVVFANDPYKILCVRNSTKGNSEIWMIDLKKGDETLLLSNADKGFSDPAISPDGKWVLVVGNSLSSISKKQNTDIYAVRIDGTDLTQITYHPEVDCSPVWSADGKSIYFISSRANKDRKFAIWRIANPLN